MASTHPASPGYSRGESSWEQEKMRQNIHPLAKDHCSPGRESMSLHNAYNWYSLLFSSIGTPGSIITYLLIHLLRKQSLPYIHTNSQCCKGQTLVCALCISSIEKSSSSVSVFEGGAWSPGQVQCILSQSQGRGNPSWKTPWAEHPLAGNKVACYYIHYCHYWSKAIINWFVDALGRVNALSTSYNDKYTLYTWEVPHLSAVLAFMLVAFMPIMPTDSLSIEWNYDGTTNK